MTQDSQTTIPFLNAFRGLKISDNAPAFVQDLRARARDYLASATLPGARDEEWKYTNLVGLASVSFGLPGKDLPVPDATGILSSEDINIVFANGRFQPAMSAQSFPAGVTVTMGWGCEGVLKDSFAWRSKNDVEVFLRLNECFVTEPVVIDIDRGVRVDKAIRLCHVVDRNAAFFPRVMVRLGPGAWARVMETFVSRGEAPCFIGNVSDLVLDREADVELVQTFVNSAEAFQVASTRVRQARDSRLRSFQFSNGANIFRNNLSVALEGEGAEAVVNGLHELKDVRQADSHTFVDHLAPNAKSNQLYKSILSGEAHSVFNGKILVRREAQLTNSYQLNKNLLLSREARVDTKPQLEIFADDVKCSHGATIGQLDEDQLFYLEARGINREEATAMLIRGFVDDVVNQVKDQRLKRSLVSVMS